VVPPASSSPGGPAGPPKSASDFYVAGKGVPWIQVGIAMVGSYLSAASFLGCAGDIGVFGIDSIWLSIGFFGGYMAVLLLIAGPLRNVGSYTVAGALHRRFRMTASSWWS
jgi:cation/acetate symporter